MIVRARTPANRLASGLMPTASISRPSAVRRASRPVSAHSPMASRIANGSVKTKPSEMNSKLELWTVVICALVISIATPRPPVMSTSVAMIGWMPSTETRKPFHRPSTTQTAVARKQASTAVPTADSDDASEMKTQATAPAIAAMAPTDRSMPRVAITSVMPRPTSNTGAELRAMSITLPYMCPCTSCTERKSECAIRLITISVSTAPTGHTSGLVRRRCRTGVRGSDMIALLARLRAGDDLEHVAHLHVVVGPLVDLASVAHDDEGVGEPKPLFELGRDEDNRHAASGKVGNELLDLRLRADVDATGGFVQDQDP